jgi:poly-gamma-glutamate synthesis protein (capsule biosynthesis protein)
MKTETLLKSLLTISCKAFLVLSIVSCIRGSHNTSGSDTYAETDSTPDSIRLVFVGDVMGHSTQTKGAWRDGGDSCYNFTPTFQWVKDYISSADIAIANLEVTFAGEPYTGYPRFSSPVALADALKEAGFDILLTANNHILDNGTKGLELTIDVLENLGISHTGSFKDSTDWKNNHPLMIQKNGFNLAFLNYTYGTNGFTVRPPVMVNYMDTLQVADDLAKCSAMNADFIIACIHWGEEYQNSENEAQRQFADFLSRNGCNLIVGGHPHVVQPIEKIAGMVADSVPVAWSLGNFVSNQRWRYSDGGIMLEVTLTKTGSTIELQSCKYEPFWVHRYPDKNAQLSRVILINDYLSNPERYPALTAEDEKKLMQFYTDTRIIIEN